MAASIQTFEPCVPGQVFANRRKNQICYANVQTRNETASGKPERCGAKQNMKPSITAAANLPYMKTGSGHCFFYENKLTSYTYLPV
jgi:hypothetical protein